jgi:hypothetical protein
MLRIEEAKVKSDSPVIADARVFTSKVGGNGAVPPKDSEVNVIVYWNGQTEQFTIVLTDTIVEELT